MYNAVNRLISINHGFFRGDRIHSEVRLIAKGIQATRDQAKVAVKDLGVLAALASNRTCSPGEPDTSLRFTVCSRCLINSQDMDFSGGGRVMFVC